MSAYSRLADQVLPDAPPRGRAAAASRKVTVLLAAPYAPQGGGMGRIMAYVAAEAALLPEFRLVMLETRGAGGGVASILHVLRAVARLIGARARGKVLLHVNVAGGVSIFRKGLLICTAHLLGCPVVLHLHAADLEDTYAQLNWPADALVRRLFGMARKVIVLGSPWLGFVSQNLGVAPRQIICLPNGVPDTGPAPARAAQPQVTLAFVGNLLARKGIIDLLQAIALPGLAGLDIRLKIAGGGDTAELRAMCADLGITDTVDMLGWLDRAAVTRLFAATDIVVLPSYHEALPLVLLEAACQRCAIVTTRAGAIGEYFSHGQDALLVAPGDIAALHRAIARLVEDRGLRLRLGRNARALYERSFTMPRMMEALANVYRACLAPDSAAPAE